MFIYIPGSRKGKGILFTALAVIMLLFAGSSVFSLVAKGDEAPKDVCDISYTDLKKGTIYKMEPIILDCYASEDNDSNVNHPNYYCIAAFLTDDSSILNAVSIKVEPRDDIYPAVEAYINDENASMGDCVVPGYYNLSNLYLEGKELPLYYGELKDGLIENEVLYEEEFTDFSISYEYDASLTPEQVVAEQKESAKVLALLFGVIGALCAVLAYVFFKPKKEKSSTKIEYVEPTEVSDAETVKAVEPTEASDPKNYTPEM